MEGTDAHIPSPEEFFGVLKAKRYPCKTCAHPALEQLERARANGVSFEALSKWLQEFYPAEQRINATTITNHFSSGHHKHP